MPFLDMVRYAKIIEKEAPNGRLHPRDRPRFARA
jgi:hypothetical protein